MENEDNKKSYVNPDFTAAFKRVRDILDDLKDRIKPLREGNAYNFRWNINNSIGTIPEFDENGNIKYNEEDNTYADGDGMSGAVFAMGEAFEKGLGNLGDALNQFDGDATTAIRDFNTESSADLAQFNADSSRDLATFNGKATEALETANELITRANTAVSTAETSATNASTYEGNAQTSADNASTYETNAQTSADNASTYEGNAQTSATETANTATEAKKVLDSLTFEIGEKFEQALEDAAGNANQAAEDAREAAKGIITNTFFVVAEADSATNSYPVTKDEQGNETRIKQEAPGAIWFKVISNGNVSIEETENTENIENTEIV